MSLEDFSGSSLLVAFIVYCISFMCYVIALAGKKWSKRDPERHLGKWSSRAFFFALLGFLGHFVYFIVRWVAGKHIPTSNMFEFMTFLGMMITFAFVVVYLIYRKPMLGAFAMPIVILILSYAAVFPHDIEPLIPALKSYWLYIHVTTAATGEAFFAVGFAAGLMYLLRTIDFTSKNKSAVKAKRGFEAIMLVAVIVIGFVLVNFTFKWSGYEASFTQQIKVLKDKSGERETRTVSVDYTLPAIVKPYNSQMKHMDEFAGMKEPLFEAPSWMKGINAGRKLNTIIWSLAIGLILYALIRLILRKPVGQAIQPVLSSLDPDDLDEISYRAIAIGYPIFALGGIIFASIWAAEAWGRFWAFDPKETWALITFLFYTVYLHFRLSRGWHGSKSSWMSVVGFIVVMFTLIGVNLVIAGLHSYAGV